MSHHDVEISLNLPYEALVSAIHDLGPDGFVEFVKDVDKKLADWSTIAALKPYVDAEHRRMVEEETEDLAERTGKCTRAAAYEDIWVHTNPHVGCVLR